MLRCCAWMSMAGLLSLLMTEAFGAEKVTYFRHDGGVAPPDARPLPHEFSDEELVWKQPVQTGHSTPAVSGGRMFLTTHKDEELATVALDLETGSPLWRRVAPNQRIEPHHRVGSPAAASIASDGERIYVFFGSYGLLCYDHEGKLVWSKPLGPFQDEFGAPSSPILAGDKLILNEDHDVGSFLLALDKKTGRKIWKAPRDEFVRSYATPMVLRVRGELQVIVPGALQLVAYDLETGEKRWWVNGLARIVNTTPAAGGGLVFVATWSPGGDPGERISMEPWSEALENLDADGDGKLTREEVGTGPVLNRFFRIDTNQNQKLEEAEWNRHAGVFRLAQNSIIAIRPGGKGNVTDEAIMWRYEKGIPYVPSPLLYRGVVYLVKDSGIITALDAETGEVLKRGRAEGRGNYYASPVAGDGKVYLASERGVITVLEAGRKWKVIGEMDFGERIMATPVIHGDRIYIRTGKAVYCFAKR